MDRERCVSFPDFILDCISICAFVWFRGFLWSNFLSLRHNTWLLNSWAGQLRLNKNFICKSLFHPNAEAMAMLIFRLARWMRCIHSGPIGSITSEYIAFIVFFVPWVKVKPELKGQIICVYPCIYKFSIKNINKIVILHPTPHFVLHITLHLSLSISPYTLITLGTLAHCTIG